MISHSFLQKILPILCLLQSLSFSIAQAQLFIANKNNNTVSEYNPTSGALMNASFITGLNEPTNVILNGNDLYVTNVGNGVVGEYNATTGVAMDASFITGLSFPWAVVPDGSNTLLVGSGSTNMIGTYNATSGQVSNTSFITTDLNDEYGVVVYSNDVYVANFGSGAITEYNLSNGNLVNSSFISGLSNPQGLYLTGSDLFVSENGNGMGNKIAEYDITNASLIRTLTVNGGAPVGITGTGSDLFVVDGTEVSEFDVNSGNLLNATLVSGLANNPRGIAVGSLLAAPEPRAWMFALSVVVLMVGLKFYFSSGKSCRL
jgi:glucose/arabinose dehydrogenase